MQTSDKKTCFQLSECSLSYAKISKEFYFIGRIFAEMGAI